MCPKMVADVNMSYGGEGSLRSVVFRRLLARVVSDNVNGILCQQRRKQEFCPGNTH